MNHGEMRERRNDLLKVARMPSAGGVASVNALVGASLLSVLFDIGQALRNVNSGLGSINSTLSDATEEPGPQFVTLPTPIGEVHLDRHKIVGVENVEGKKGVCDVLLGIGKYHGIRIQLSPDEVLTRLGEVRP